MMDKCQIKRIMIARDGKKYGSKNVKELESVIIDVNIEIDRKEKHQENTIKDKEKLNWLINRVNYIKTAETAEEQARKQRGQSRSQRESESEWESKRS